MFGNDMGTKSTKDDAIVLGNKVVEGTAIIQLEATTNELIEKQNKSKGFWEKLFGKYHRYRFEA